MVFRRLRISLITLVVLCGSFSLWGRTAPSSFSKKYQKSIPKVKVRIAKELRDVTISGTDLKRNFYLNNSSKSFAGRKKIHFNCYNPTSKRMLSKPVLLASLSSPTGLVSLSEEKYQGDLHIVTSANGQSCDVVNEVPMESYISSLLSKEMNGGWPVEVLKAQAVAARSYALHKMKTKEVSKKLGHNAYYDLESSEKHQVNGDFFDITNNTLQASYQTKGEVLIAPSGELTPIFFHAKCGGRTLKPDQVWDNHVEGYESVPCPFCQHRGKEKSWDAHIAKERFVKFLNWVIEQNGIEGLEIKVTDKLMVAPDREKNIKLRIYKGEQVLVVNKTLFRRYFGRTLIRSNYFDLNVTKNNFLINGKGRGHGVGMCQLGALQLADMGWDYKKILAYYFPKHRLIKAY